MAKKRASKKKTNNSSSKDDRKVFAFLATFFTIVGFIIALIAKREDKYVMFYAKQGLVLFILQFAISIIDNILFGIFLGPFLWLFFVVVWVMAWINALSGDMKDTWLIGEFAKKIKL